MTTQDSISARRIYLDRLKSMRERERRHLSAADFALFTKRFDKLIAEVEADLRQRGEEAASGNRASAVWLDMLFPVSPETMKLSMPGETWPMITNGAPANWLNTVLLPPAYRCVGIHYAGESAPELWSYMNTEDWKTGFAHQAAKTLGSGWAIHANNRIGFQGEPHRYSVQVENRCAPLCRDLPCFAFETA